MSAFIVGIGGTVRPGSSSEAALRLALGHAAAAGATTRCFGGAELASLPMYAPNNPDRGEVARDLVESLRRADGVVIASPGYHGSISGLVKNALDYCEDMRDDDRIYLAGRAVGCLTTAYGWQAAVPTLEAMRSIVHALRGWPTPLGVTINSAESRFASDGTPDDEAVADKLAILANEVLWFVASQAAASSATLASSVSSGQQ